VSAEQWTVVVPVKPAGSGKSRLEGAAAARQELARAIALDTIAAAAQVARVVVVTADDGIAACLDGGVAVIADPGAGLNAAVAAGAAAAGVGTWRAALLGDVPALRPADLAAALEAAARYERAVVGDADGTGSTLVTAAPGVPWQSAFGPDSFRRHLELGFTALPISDASTLRHDVDTPAQLATAVALGLGPRTAAVLRPPVAPVE
jgi:2-phospho-L-lactate guanylyltransferase